MTDVTPADSVTEYEPEPIFDDADELPAKPKSTDLPPPTEPPIAAGDPSI